jgi:tetratricopeptide (TPR) repeat protein
MIGAVERIVRNPRPQDRWALWLYAQHMCATAADLWLERGDPDRALKYADECIDRAVTTSRPKNEVKGRRARGRALLVEGSLDQAERELSDALERAIEIGNPPQIWKTYAALGELRSMQHRDADAADCYAQALSVVEDVAGKLEDSELRSTLLDSALVRSYRAAART